MLGACWTKEKEKRQWSRENGDQKDQKIMVIHILLESRNFVLMLRQSLREMIIA